MPTRPALTVLELARLAAGLQQQELARRAGIAPGRLSAFECARQIPSDAQQTALCMALGYPKTTLFPARGSQIGELAIRRWILSLNDEGPAARPSPVTTSPGQGRHAAP